MEKTQELSEIINRHLAFDGIEPCALPRVKLIRSTTITPAMPTTYEPSLCLVAQGKKHVTLGHLDYVYDASQYLVASVDLPLQGSIIEASEECPYFCISLDLNVTVLSELMLEHGTGASATTSKPGIALSTVTPDLMDAAVRLLRLLDTPDDIPALAPLVEREILYRLLHGEQSEMMRHIANAESRLSQVSRAIVWIKDHYAEPFSIERLAREAGMSSSSLHEHFKAVTTYSPLQYRTRLRLQEARRIMVSDALDAASAGFKVGYESPSQFSRDYVRVFGAPPMQDAQRLRANPGFAMA
ncbi:AraC-type DNA-binding protein [Parasphingorhabdus marina DSM 22363]|uniref:AraC-type DNA-binding protein n=1 Tax=Parasphingorhabdus marina DSM 22363 TaxID=1123272 RepID=A0A1N6EXZ2_9SPHN|nr:AraC family transcriptional regulator [Parasphingorhabdus marina]SIN87823.1 AraC-type DNA-binding protein [Parasphingorhabdus marina DSM 22363]